MPSAMIKYDPISQYDFYRLRAFFDGLDLFKDHPLPGHEPPPVPPEVREDLQLQAARVAARSEETAAELGPKTPICSRPPTICSSALGREDRRRHGELSPGNRHPAEVGQAPRRPARPDCTSTGRRNAQPLPCPR
ncbi:MAG: hypothetical protein U0992_03650 [Planctomycetaceae bacterium]